TTYEFSTLLDFRRVLFRSTGDDQRGFFICYRQQGFEAPQGTIGTPVLSQFHRCTHQLAAMGFELRFESFKQGKGVSSASGETGDDLIFIKTAYFAGVALHYRITE